MRLEDISDYFKLRSLVANPWEVLRFRRGQRPGQTLTVQMQGEPPLFLNGGQADYHMFHRIFLRDEYRLAGRDPGAWECVVDLGANVGLFSACAARVARRVVALEPSPQLFGQLARNVEARKEVEALQLAVAARPGSVRLYRPRGPGLTGASSTHANRAELVSEEYDEVASTSLDALFRDHRIERCDLLKIDIEGMEYEALGAASSDTLARVQRIHGEYHEVAGDDPASTIEGLEALLRGQGFEVERIPHRKKHQHGMFFAARPGTS